jgi:hypothetical protein
MLQILTVIPFISQEKQSYRIQNFKEKTRNEEYGGFKEKFLCIHGLGLDSTLYFRYIATTKKLNIPHFL